MVNYFWPEILIKYFNLNPDGTVIDRFDQDEGETKYFVYPITARDAVNNFLKFFEAAIADYRKPKYADFKSIQKGLTNLKVTGNEVQS